MFPNIDLFDIDPEPAEWAATIATRTAYRRAHRTHLLDDPTDICLPAFNNTPFAPVDITGHPPHPRDPATTVDLQAALWQAEDIVHIHLLHYTIHAATHIGLLGHARECTDTSCIDVWTTARHRHTTHGTHTYVLKAGGAFSGGPPIITTIDDHLSLLRAFDWVGITNPDSITDGQAYEITLDTANDLTAGRTPRAAPLPITYP